ncbi:MAG: hypothetical protein RL685_3444 [Pseudomonadota bacterium]|jgi:hypothetical protein
MDLRNEAQEQEATRSAELWNAQLRAEALFDAIVRRGMIRAGMMESELNEEIHQLAQLEFGVSRHSHRRIVRSGENTLTSFREAPPERQLLADDVSIWTSDLSLASGKPTMGVRTRWVTTLASTSWSATSGALSVKGRCCTSSAPT